MLVLRPEADKRTGSLSAVKEKESFGCLATTGRPDSTRQLSTVRRTPSPDAVTVTREEEMADHLGAVRDTTLP